MRRTLFAVMALAASLAAAAPRQGPTEPFKRSDAQLLSATGRPQFVDFYHPR